MRVVPKSPVRGGQKNAGTGPSPPPRLVAARGPGQFRPPMSPPTSPDSPPPQDVALIDARGPTTYAVLRRETRVWAERIAGTAGYRKGQQGAERPRVCYLVPPGADHVAVLRGIWASGCVAVPLALSHPPPELAYVLEDADPFLVVIGEGTEHGGPLRSLATASGRAVLDVGNGAQGGARSPGSRVRRGCAGARAHDLHERHHGASKGSRDHARECSGAGRRVGGGMGLVQPRSHPPRAPAPSRPRTDQCAVLLALERGDL